MNYKLTHADATTYLASPPAELARLCVADPPYNISVKYDEYDDCRPLVEYVNWLDCLTRLAASCLTPDGSLWLILSDETAAEACVMTKRHLRLRNWVIWQESFGVHCETKFSRTKRHVFHFIRQPTHVFHPPKVPSARQTKYNDKRANPAGKTPGDVWEISRVCGTFKERVEGVPTQLPLALTDRIVLTASDPGDLILDPCCGSGTTGVSALRHGRRFHGIDLSAAYLDVARKRLEDVVPA